MVQELKHKPEILLSTKIMVLSFDTRNHSHVVFQVIFPLLTKNQLIKSDLCRLSNISQAHDEP